MCLGLSNNRISDIRPIAENEDIRGGIDLRGNPLNDEAYEVHIPALLRRGVEVLYDRRR